jgi:hypothetical protein
MLKFLRDTPCRHASCHHRKKLMKKLLHISLLSLLLGCGLAYAEGEKMSQKTEEEKMHKKGKQQEKMKRCNAEAKGMKGDERKMKMSECLKG